MSKDKPPDKELTALERYLAKKRGTEGAASESAQPRTPQAPKQPDRALEYGVPAEPERVTPPPTPPPPAVMRMGPLGETAGFGARFMAYVVDVVIVWALSLPLDLVFQIVFGVLTFGMAGSDFIESLSFFTVVFCYYGYFYREKGASVGKLLLQLEVVNAETGARLGYWRTFFRETLGKMVSSLPMLLGFVIAAFRHDGKTFHDMLFDTQVINRREKNQTASL